MKNKKLDLKKRYDDQDEMMREINEVIYAQSLHFGAIQLDEVVVIEEALQLAIRNL